MISYLYDFIAFLLFNVDYPNDVARHGSLSIKGIE